MREERATNADEKTGFFGERAGRGFNGVTKRGAFLNVMMLLSRKQRIEDMQRGNTSAVSRQQLVSPCVGRFAARRPGRASSLFCERKELLCRA
jgi:hypothetical protein